MKTLILIRHGKSSWETPSTDKERPLIDRGIQDIQNVAKIYQNDLPNKFLVWSSNAKRAKSTAILFSEKIGYKLEDIIFKNELYTFDNIELENIIKTCDDLIENLIIFGHNSAITDFVNKTGDIFIENVPTSGLVKIEFDVNSWKQITNGKIKKAIFPKDLR